MQRRLLVILLVFVVGFGVGYGVTWLLVGSGSRGERPARDTSAQSATTTPATTPPATTPATTTVAATSDASSASDVAAAAAPDAKAADAVAAAATDAAAQPTDVVAATATGNSDAKVAASDTTAAPTAEVAEAPKAAWDLCHLHACRVDFGKMSGGISIRKGSLEHGQEVDWDHDFAKADRIGTLASGPDVTVEVLAVGLQNGEPAAAYIMRKTKKTELKGVIALRIGDKKLKLVPLD